MLQCKHDSSNHNIMMPLLYKEFYITLIIRLFFLAPIAVQSNDNLLHLPPCVEFTYTFLSKIA